MDPNTLPRAIALQYDTGEIVYPAGGQPQMRPLDQKKVLDVELCEHAAGLAAHADGSIAVVARAQGWRAARKPA